MRGLSGCAGLYGRMTQTRVPADKPGPDICKREAVAVARNANVGSGLRDTTYGGPALA